ncbi:phosphatase PAP2 family protein [Aestuariispira insulae]|uniref:PAP2 superfamily protein n=1 Tax=Aestuariispira insulae TaxID=1461337 RepID=A0A3D9HV45_9PROT|nr:phosphatase PAP2 family protein [Aestuariispira insulae]RED53383.1 PAP2 superfamily protein [Aestuariispira insulae]
MADNSYKYSDAGQHWRPGLIAGCTVLSVVWVGSLFWGPLVPIWDWLDRKAFFFLNGSLLESGAWSQLWAYLNTRAADIVWAILMALPLLWVMIFDRRWAPHERLARVLLIGFSMLIAVFIAKRLGGEIGRWSPSNDLRPFVDLSKMFPELQPKTGSNDSFPGDHGVTALIYFIGFVVFIKRPWLTVLAGFIVLANTMPRLMGGGHWISDVLVGAVGFTLATYPWMVGSPALQGLQRLVKPASDKLLWPVLRKIGISPD